MLALFKKKKKDEEVGEKAILMLEQVVWSCSDYQSRNLFRFLSRIIYLCWILCSIAFKLHSEGNRKLKGEKQLRNDEICGSLLLSSLLASKIYSFILCKSYNSSERNFLGWKSTSDKCNEPQEPRTCLHFPSGFMSNENYSHDAIIAA